MELFFKLLLVFFLVLLNGFFVAAEFALVAVRRTRITELVRKGNPAARLVYAAHKDLDSYISATQLGITIASLALGWVGEPALAHFFEPFFYFLPQTAALFGAHSLSVIIAFTLITILHVVVGEVVPKTVALQKPEPVSLFIAPPLILFTKIFKPLIWFLNSCGDLVLKLLRFSPTHGHQLVHSEEEIKIILAQSVEGGAIEPAEAKMASRVFRLADIPVRQIMVPRTNIVAFNVANTLKEIMRRIEGKTHSRFPVYEQTIDTIIGFIHIKDIYHILKNADMETPLIKTNLIRPIIHISEEEKADEVLFAMQRKRIHIAAVIDTYGGTAGIVALEDIIESVVGEIEDEFETPSRLLQRQKDGSYIVSGRISLQELTEKMSLSIRGPGYTTIGSLVAGLLGSASKKGDKIKIGRVTIEVLELDQKRIKTLRISKHKKTL